MILYPPAYCLFFVALYYIALRASKPIEISELSVPKTAQAWALSFMPFEDCVFFLLCIRQIA